MCHRQQSQQCGIASYTCACEVLGCMLWATPVHCAGFYSGATLRIRGMFRVCWLQGCVGLVTPDALDVLSHAAVRARNCSVLLASCSDAAALQGLRALAGRSVELSISQVGRPDPPGSLQPTRHTAAAASC